MVEQSQLQYRWLAANNVTVSLDGRRVLAPTGVVDSEGFANLQEGFMRQQAKRNDGAAVAVVRATQVVPLQPKT